MSNDERFAEAFPAIVTKAECEQRLRELARPIPVLQCNPSGFEADEVRRLNAQSVEDRYAFLTRRLENAGKSVDTQYSFARLRGKPRSDFEQSI